MALSTFAAAIVSCEDATGPGSSVAIKFGAAPPGASAARAFPPPVFSVAGTAQDELTVTGSNGTLTITDIRVIVEEFELEPVEVVDCDVEPEPEGCADFEARYFFIDVPLSGDPITIVNEQIPANSYDELEFEVDDVEVDADDPEEVADSALIRQLFETIRAEFPDWPDKASMIVVGSFTPTNSTTGTPFHAYFEAEIEVELEFDTPLVITDDGASSVVVEVNPNLWFTQADGTVLDLSQFDYDADAGEPLIKFELEIEGGFDLEIET